MTSDPWQDASSYDRFMGRWSRTLARKLVEWLEVRPSASWLEIGCGTGSLTSAICELASPKSVLACDVTPDYVDYCREHLHDPALTVRRVAAGQIPKTEGGFSVVVSSLVLNFLPDPVQALVQMRDATSPEGCVAAAVWDYAEGMEFLRLFWDAAAGLDPSASKLHEGHRFPICRPDALRRAFEAAGLPSPRVDSITIATDFESFDDFWAPFIDGPGPAPAYVAGLSDPARRRLTERLREVLGPGTPIHLGARAWVAKGLRGSA